MKFSLISSLMAVLLLTFTNCKKKENPPETTNNPSPQTPESGYGIFESSYKTTKFLNGTTYKDSTVTAKFYENSFSAANSVPAGTVSVNGYTLAESTNPVYYAWYNGIPMSPLVWTVSGNATISPMSFSYTPAYPQFHENNQLPDTVIKSSGITFTINGVYGTNQPVMFSIDQGGLPVTRTLTAFPATILITPSEISGFIQNYTFNMNLSFFNYSNITLNNRQCSVKAIRYYKKYCYLK